MIKDVNSNEENDMKEEKSHLLPAEVLGVKLRTEKKGGFEIVRRFLSRSFEIRKSFYKKEHTEIIDSSDDQENQPTQKPPLAKGVRGDFRGKFKLTFYRGVALALGLSVGALLSVAISGTVNTFNNGDALTSSLMNQNFTSLSNAIQGIPDWTKNGVNAYYTAGNVGIGTTVPDTSCNTSTKLCVVGGHIYNNGNNNILNRANAAAWDTFGSTHFQIDGTTYSKVGIYDTNYLRANSGLIVDGNVGIGITNPARPLEIASNNIVAGNPSVLVKGDNNTERFAVESSVDAVFQAGKYGGTQSSKTATLAGTNLGFFQAGGYDGVTQYYNRAAMYMYAGENFTSTAHGTGIKFHTVPLGSTSKVDQVIITPAGNVGIGTTSPTTKLQVNAGGFSAFRIGNNASGGSSWDINPGDSGLGLSNKLIMGYVGAVGGGIGGGDTYNVITLTTSGQIGINTTSPVQNLTVNGNAGNTTGVWVNNSDERLKKNIQPLEKFLDRLTQLRPVTFEWKDHKKLNAKEGKHIGFIAQEVEKLFPFWVDTDKNGMKWLSTEGINAVFVQSIKELSSEGEKTLSRLQIIESHHRIVETRVQELEKENSKLREEIKSLHKATLTFEERLLAMENRQVVKR